MSLMAGDFNCHANNWNPEVQGRRGMANTLLETAGDLGLELAGFVNPGPMFFSRIQGNRPSVLDLVFLKPAHTLAGKVTRMEEHQGPSDHVPVSATLDIGEDTPVIEKQTLKKDSKEEMLFLGDVQEGIAALGADVPLPKTKLRQGLLPLR
jgi:hypothetical protein